MDEQAYAVYVEDLELAAGKIRCAIEDRDESMTAFGPMNDKWMRGFLAALADEGLAIVEVDTDA